MKLKGNTNNILSLILSLIVALIPKCPHCWASYMSAFGVISIQSIPHPKWVIRISALLLLVNLFFLYKKAKKTNRIIPLLLSSTGIILLNMRAFMKVSKIWTFLAIGMIFVGALLNNMDKIYQSFLGDAKRAKQGGDGKEEVAISFCEEEDCCTPRNDLSHVQPGSTTTQGKSVARP